MENPDDEQRKTASVKAIFYHHVIFDYLGEQGLKQDPGPKNTELRGKRIDIFFPGEDLILRDVRSPYSNHETDIPGTWYRALVGDAARKRVQELKAAIAQEEERQVPADVLEWAKALYTFAHPPESVVKITREALKADYDFHEKRRA